MTDLNPAAALELAMSDVSLPIVVRTDRAKSFRFFLVCAVFVACGAFMFASGKDRLIALSVILIFSAVALLSLSKTVFPSTLRIDDAGFRWQGLRNWQVAWKDVERLRFANDRRNAIVYVDYNDATASQGRPNRKRSRAIALSALQWTPPEIASFLEEGLATARRADPSLACSPDDAPAPLVFEPKLVVPWLSLGLVVVLVLVFLGEIQWPLSSSSSRWQPSVSTLVAFGGLSRTLLLDQGQWFRLVVAPFLHGSPSHLLFNGVALLLAGRSFEGFVGRSWFAATYIFGALAGGVGSLLLNPPTTVSVGASGAIVALFAAMFVCSFQLSSSRARSRMQSRAIGILVPTLLSIGKSADGLTIDFGAHLGGAVGGALVGLLLLKNWSPSGERPDRQRLGLAISAAGALLAVGAVWPAVMTYGKFWRSAFLIPEASIPANGDIFVEQAPAFLTRYPGDPRSHTVMAMLLLRQGNAAEAEVQARQGLSDVVGLRDLFDARVEAALWMVLGEALGGQDRDTDALAAYDTAISTDKTLPGAYFFRASLRFKHHDLDHALPDAKTYVALAPTIADGWGLEGDVSFAAGDAPDAVKAYETQSRLAGTIQHKRTLGLAKFYAGDSAGALADLQDAVSAAPDDLYAALWLDIVREREGLAASLSDITLRSSAQHWPAAVVRYYENQISPAQLSAFAQAEKPQPADQICEADFYIAERDRMQGRLPQADGGFRKALGECPAIFVESWMARSELTLDVAR